MGHKSDIHPRATVHECAGCGDDFAGSHAVRDGEHYCNDCVTCKAAERRREREAGERERAEVSRTSISLSATAWEGYR